jgi:glycosyltransferase involved in cell wall biosynthesis
MRVQMFAPYCYPVPGGQETHVWELSKALARTGVDVSFLTRYAFSRSKLETALFYAGSLPKISTAVDLIHGHDIQVAAALKVWKVVHSKPSVLTVHSSNFLETRQKWAGFYRQLFSKHKALLATSRELADACRPLYPGPVHYIPNGVDAARFAPGSRDSARATLGLPDDSTILLTTRRLDRKNNVIALAQAFDELSKADPKLRLLIVGEGEQRAAIESLHNDRISITGWVDNSRIADYLHAADLFVMPSLYEATSISCLEAMACGLPVVVTRVGGLPDLVDGNGLLCEPTSSSLSSAIHTALGSDLSAMGKRSRTIAEERFSWASVAAQHKRVYEQALV